MSDLDKESNMQFIPWILFVAGVFLLVHTMDTFQYYVKDERLGSLGMALMGLSFILDLFVLSGLLYTFGMIAGVLFAVAGLWGVLFPTINSDKEYGLAED